MQETKVVYHIQYQPLRSGASRPEDWGSCHAYTCTGRDSAPLLPSVGDFVQLEPLGASDGYLKFSGRVRSRLFRQFTHVDNSEDGKDPLEVHIAVNIVVEETNDDWGLLIKE
jgi:hypothetical protein